jgi:hypothetical protein
LQNGHHAGQGNNKYYSSHLYYLCWILANFGTTFLLIETVVLRFEVRLEPAGILEENLVVEETALNWHMFLVDFLEFLMLYIPEEIFFVLIFSI